MVACSTRMAALPLSAKRSSWSSAFSSSLTPRPPAMVAGSLAMACRLSNVSDTGMFQLLRDHAILPRNFRGLQFSGFDPALDRLGRHFVRLRDLGYGV